MGEPPVCCGAVPFVGARKGGVMMSADRLWPDSSDVGRRASNMGKHLFAVGMLRMVIRTRFAELQPLGACPPRKAVGHLSISRPMQRPLLIVRATESLMTKSWARRVRQ